MSAVSSPDLMYLQLANRQRLWLDLQEDLDTYMHLTDQQAIPDVKKGTLVMAKFPLEEDKWYRCKVMDIRSRQVSLQANPSASESLIEVDVFFLDTGEQEWVSKDDLQPLDICYLQLPFQAIEAIIMHLVPKGSRTRQSIGYCFKIINRILFQNNHNVAAPRQCVQNWVQNHTVFILLQKKVTT